MTLAPSDRLTDPSAGAAPVATVTAVLVLRGGSDVSLGAGREVLAQTLDSLARQTRAPDRLLVVDTGLDGNAMETVRTHTGLAQTVRDVAYVTVPPSPTLAGAVTAALAADRSTEAHTDPAEEAAHLWLLTADSAAAPTTLARLLDAVRRSPSVGVAGPKLLEWERPGVLQSVGLQLTRSGRLVPSPAPGEPDQGQYDRRSDVLAVPATGLLVERDLFDRLHGPDPALGELGADLDFSWRAQQAGRRVVVVPRATVRTGVADPEAAPVAATSHRRRRQARRVALVRCAWWAVPLLTLWVVLTGTLAAVALLVAKRPKAAWAELSDVAGVLTPWRVLTARWRSRGTRRIRRRDLHGLFIPATTVLRHAGDLIHDEVGTDRAAPRGDELQPVEAGPVADEAQDLNILGSTAASRALRNPGLLVTVLTTAVALAAGRHLQGGFLDRLRSGLAGGELVGVHASAGSLWHSWLDGWHGGGLGHAGEQGPHLVVLAGLAWLVEHVPVIGSPASSVGVVTGLLVMFALPLAAAAAYLGGRVVTHSTWPRGLAALAWATTAVLSSAVAVGRLGAVVAAVLLPLVAAGVSLTARRSGSVTVTAATVLGAAVLGAFAPALLVPVLLAGVGLLILAPAGAKVRGLALVVGPLLLLGPWVESLLSHPYLLLTGPGLSVWGAHQALPWQLALLHPGGPASYPVVLSAPVVAAGVLGLLRSGRRGRAATVLGLLAVAGLAYAVAAPRLRLGTVPSGSRLAGEPITAWAGTGLLVLSLSMVAAALLGAEGLAVRRARGGWLAVLRWPVGAAVVLAVLAGAGWTGWRTFGDALGSWHDPRPAVALDQAETGLANRMLLLTPDHRGLSYALLGREPGDVARILPPAAETERGDQGQLLAAVGVLFEQGTAPGESDPAAALARQGVGFVGLRTESTDPRIRTLDATAGLSRLGDHRGMLFWRVLAGGGAATDTAVAPSRARLVTARSQQAVPVDGDHGRLRSAITVPADATLELAEPAGWVRHARVSVDGSVVAPTGDAAQYALPPGRHTVAVDVLPTDRSWRYAQGAALLLTIFLALPFGARRARRRP